MGGGNRSRHTTASDAMRACCTALSFALALAVCAPPHAATRDAGAEVVPAVRDPLAAAIAGRPAPAPPPATPTDHLSFAALAHDRPDAMADRRIADRGGWSIYLPANRIPAGRKLATLLVNVGLEADAGGDPAIATVALNGHLLASRTIRAGSVGRIVADVPDGLAATVNRIDVNVLVRERVDASGAPLTRRVALLGSSHAGFAPAGPVGDFRDLPPAFARGVTLVLPAAMRGDDARVAGLSRLLSGMVAASTPMTVRSGAMPAQGPVIWVSDRAPPDTIAPIPMQIPGTRIRDGEGATLFSARAIAGLTVAQLVREQGDGGDSARLILWIRPGPGFAALAALPAGAELSYGDVALFDAGSRVFAMHSARERIVRIERPGDFDPAAWLADNRPWLVLGAWALVTALFGWLLAQTRRARDAAPSGRAAREGAMTHV